MKKIIMLGLVLLTVTGILFAERTALIKTVSGKVEYRSGNAAWSAVQAGMKLPLGATLSTGFDSRAVIEIGTTTISVAPLTRMRIDQLSEKEGMATTGVSLRVGRVKADVKPVQGLQTDFIIKSPVTTASVRGTSFEFDTESVKVDEGVVVVTDAYNQYLAVKAGDSATYDDGEISADMEDSMTVSIDTSDIGSSVNSGSGGGVTSGSSAEQEFGSIKVEWTFYGAF